MLPASLAFLPQHPKLQAARKATNCSEEGACLHLLCQRRERTGGGRREDYERVSPSSKTTHGGGWRSFGSEVEPGPAPPLPALGGAGATAPAPPPAVDPCRRQVPSGPIARPTESRHQALWIG